MTVIKCDIDFPSLKLRSYVKLYNSNLSIFQYVIFFISRDLNVKLLFKAILITGTYNAPTTIIYQLLTLINLE